MAEYIEREAAFDAVFGQFCASSDETEQALNAAIEEIKTIPAADVAPVVRCGECKYSANARVNEKGFLICPASGMEITDNDYCSYGARMGGDGE